MRYSENMAQIKEGKSRTPFYKVGAKQINQQKNGYMY
jgi:hypothetical protein